MDVLTLKEIQAAPQSVDERLMAHETAVKMDALTGNLVLPPLY